jgi:isoquinoline 1-oxidoreductase beta subunit
MAWGLGPVFSQEITFRNGAVEQTNYDNYAPVKMDRFPRTSRSTPSRPTVDLRHRGGGCPLIAPAICNAIHMATGKRVRSLPLSRQDLSWT